MNSTKNNIKCTKDYQAAGFININHVICIRSNWFAEIKTGTIKGRAPANEIAVWTISYTCIGIRTTLAINYNYNVLTILQILIE